MRYFGEITHDAAAVLESNGDVSYRVRVMHKRGGTCGKPAYASTLRGARGAIPRLVAKWGKYSTDRWHIGDGPTECDVIIEARERTYWWDGTQKHGVNAKAWRLLERRTVDLTGEGEAK